MAVTATVATLAAIAAIAALTAVASAQRGRVARSAVAPLTWHGAARRARFAVYRPGQTLGLKFSGLFLDHGCLLAGWGTRRGPHFGLYEPGNSAPCGQPGEATSVARKVINGVHVHILVQCPTLPRCTIRDGERRGELLLFVPEHARHQYTIQLQSTHVTLADFLRIARSFRRVR